MNRVLVVAAIVSSSAIARAESAPRVHDGFYLRLGAGLAFVRDSSVIENANEDSGTLVGGGPAGELSIGGTPAPGLVVGGGLQGATAFRPRAAIAGQSGTVDHPLTVVSFGPFVDYYFDPRRGLHLQAFAGYAALGYAYGRGLTRKTAGGGILSVGFGDEWFVSDQWSIGVLGRLQLAHTSDSDGDIVENHNLIVPAVLASFTYH